MSITFDKNGNLSQTISFSFHQFEEAFGFNEIRAAMLRPLLLTLRLFQKYGCTEVYIAGSFTTNKAHPGDIDVCVDMTYMNWQAFRKENNVFFTPEGRREYKQLYKIDVPLFFDSYSFEELEFFRKDRNGNPRGLVKLSLHDIMSYD